MNKWLTWPSFGTSWLLNQCANFVSGTGVRSWWPIVGDSSRAEMEQCPCPGLWEGWAQHRAGALPPASLWEISCLSCCPIHHAGLLKAQCSQNLQGIYCLLHWVTAAHRATAAKLHLDKWGELYYFFLIFFFLMRQRMYFVPVGVMCFIHLSWPK